MVNPKSIEGNTRPEAGETARAARRTLTMAGRGVLKLQVSHRSTYWVAASAGQIERFLVGDRLGHDRLLVTEAVGPALREYLQALFGDVISAAADRFLPFDELREALAADTAKDLALGAISLSEPQVVVVFRGDLTRIVVPWSWFRPAGDGTAPDFGDVEVIDGGLTLRLGRHESAMDAVLYEFDREYRARERLRNLTLDPSFGAALRRLRLQKGVARSDFPGVSEKEIARLERGEVERPRGATLRAVAERLGVEPAEIESY